MDDAMVGKKMINFPRNKLNELIITKMIKRANWDSLEEIVQAEAVIESEQDSEVDVELQVHEGLVVMAKRKQVFWPCRIVQIKENHYDVFSYDKNTIEQKSKSMIKNFDMNENCCRGKSSSYVKAWKSARKDYES